MPEDPKLSQIGSSPLPPPFRGLHSPGVRKNCQIIFPCYSRKSSISKGPQHLTFMLYLLTVFCTSSSVNRNWRYSLTVEKCNVKSNWFEVPSLNTLQPTRMRHISMHARPSFVKGFPDTAICCEQLDRSYSKPRIRHLSPYLLWGRIL